MPFLSLSSPQVPHYSDTNTSRLLAQQLKQDIVYYPWNKSFVNNEVFGRQFHPGRGHINGPIPLPFISVFNENTLEMSLLLGDLEGEIRRVLQECVTQYFDCAKKKCIDERRGNYQHTIGLTSGQSHQRRMDSTQITKDFGVSRPSQTGAPDQESFGAYLLLLLSHIAKRIGVPWTNAAYQEAHPEVMERLERFSRSWLKNSAFRMELPSEMCSQLDLEVAYVIFSRLAPGSKTRIHEDNQNCDKLRDCVSIGGLVYVPTELE